MASIRPKGINDVLNSKLGIIRHIIAEHGEGVIKGMLMKEISNMCQFFNFPRTMSGYQIEETAELVIESYPIYMPEDFILCFKNIKLLRYGKFFEGIDGAKILEMMAAYDLEREDQIMAVRQKEANQYKADARLMAEPVAELAKKILEKPKEVKEPAKPRQRSAIELAFDGYITDFDTLEKQQNFSQGAYRFVDYKNKIVDCAGYCNMRFDEDNQNQ